MEEDKQSEENRWTRSVNKKLGEELAKSVKIK